VLFPDEFHPELTALIAIMARSTIRITRPRVDRHDFPAEFDDVDIAILKWIAAESRPLGRQHRLS
jgi:hypothetical protein